jgi:O-antigen/teichoic acid export membrane protein
VQIFKAINLRGDLFATAFTFGAEAAIKLGSSLILTRILNPEAYGVIAILMSIVTVVEMIGDFGITIFIVRDPHAEESRYLNTAWTMRLCRAVLNSTVVFTVAPFIASSLYHLPLLSAPLHVLSIWSIVCALESMAFPLSIRRKQSRIFVYSALGATFLSTVFTVIYCHYSRDYWGMVYGTLLNRIIRTALSYQFYKDLRPRLQFDRATAREIFRFARFTMPSTLITLALSQFDKMVFLRLFDLNLLGVYGLAGNIATPIESLISRISQLVLYPRVAHDFRTDQSTFLVKYYTENVRLFVSILIIPALIGGSAHFLITVLYPSRYAQAGSVLLAFMLRAALLSLASPSEDLLIATGEYQVILVGNVYRAVWLFAASLGGFYFFGFLGFIYGIALSGLPPLIYYLWLQRSKGLLIVKYEILKPLFICGVAVLAYFISSLLLLL